jgi:UDP-N-acetylmuramoyl-L-alanyl-D-glutamate--2,6-diaminopimelate ligase
MKLSKVAQGLDLSSLDDNQLKTDIVGIAYDSRKANLGFIFVCIAGEEVDGHNFAINAYKKGCRVFITQKKLDLNSDAIQIVVENSRVALSLISCNFFSNPSSKLKIIGVTGTKGKTTVTHLISQLLLKSNINCGVIGTNGVFFNGLHQPTVNTTPESFELQRIFSNMVNSGVEVVCIEVSSQGIMMHRTDNIDFDIGVFTNLTPDHIGPKEHSSFEDYASCKAKLFSQCKVGIFNIDDEHIDLMTKNATCEIKTFSLKQSSDYFAQNIEKLNTNENFGIHFNANTPKGKLEIKLNMLGEFSAYNALATIGIAQLLNIQNTQIEDALASTLVKGRCEVIAVKDFKIIIDFAHNQASLQGLLSSLSEYEYNRLICVFGSVGGRSVLRRKDLGEIASKYCDYLIITSDNPNFEDPQNIANDIINGFSRQVEFEVIHDRKKAIQHILDVAQPNDIIALVGKGHEDYQLINGQKIPFSEIEIVNEYKELLV